LLNHHSGGECTAPPGHPPPPRGANQLLLMKLCAQFSGSSVAAVWIALTGGATVTE
jgi:hypothetical protein